MSELLVAWIAFPAIQLLLWFGCGSLVARIAPRGGDLPSAALVLPLGFCVVVVAGGFTTAVPALAEWTTPLIVALTLAGFAVGRPWRGLRPSLWLIGALVAIFAVYAAPIVLSGSATFAGYIKLDDTATWLALTDRVMESGRSLDGLAPSSYEATLAFNLADGYPIGVFIPLGVGQALVGIDPAWLIQPYMALLAVLLGIGLWNLAGVVLASDRARGLVAFVASQPALLYGYYLWGGIKELAAAALIVLAACLIVPAAKGGARITVMALPALSIAALVSVLSLAGVVWLGPSLLVALIVATAASSPARAAPKAVMLLALTAAMTVPLFTSGALVPPTSSPLDDPEARGNLAEALSPLQALGIWPAADFRFDPSEMSVTIVLCVFAAIAALVAAATAVRSRRWDLVAYLAAVPAAALAIAVVGSPWVQAKAFAIVSPTLLFAAMLGCAWAWSRRRTVLAAGVGAFIAAGVAWSNALAYSEVNLAPRDQLQELEEIAAMIAGDGPVLMTEYQPYGVRHFLRDAQPEGASELRRRVVPLADGSSLAKGKWADTDDFRADAFEPYEALVLRRSPEQSRPPGAFTRAWTGEYYEVWSRDAPRPVARLALGEGASVSSVPECADVRELAREVPGGRLRAARSEEPLFARLSETGEDELSGEVSVAAGTYELWLRGSLRSSANLMLDGASVAEAEPHLNNEGLYAKLGMVKLERGRHAFTVRFDDPSLRPGTGARPEADVLALRPVRGPDGALVEFSPGEARALCGRAWDWIEAVLRVSLRSRARPS